MLKLLILSLVIGLVYPLSFGHGQGNSTQPNSGMVVFPSGARVLNVKTDFGAVGDGVTDDTAAIQRAISRVVCNTVVAGSGFDQSKVVKGPSDWLAMVMRLNNDKWAFASPTAGDSNYVLEADFKYAGTTPAHSVVGLVYDANGSAQGLGNGGAKGVTFGISSGNQSLLSIRACKAARATAQHCLRA